MLRTIALASFAALALAVGIAERSAEAQPDFPTTLQTDLMMPCAPPCTLCHVGPQGPATATTPFALAMKANGLTGSSTLGAAIQRVSNAKIDSDGDGVADIDELLVGDDPNTVGASLCKGPQYGCGAQVSEAAPVAPLGALAALAIALLFRRRK